MVASEVYITSALETASFNERRINKHNLWRANYICKICALLGCLRRV